LSAPVVCHAPHPASVAEPPTVCALYQGATVAAAMANTPRTTIVHLVSVASMVWSPDH